MNITLSQYGGILILPEADVKFELNAINVAPSFLEFIQPLYYNEYISGAMRFKSLDRSYPFSVLFTSYNIDDAINLLKLGIDSIAIPHLSELESLDRILNFVRKLCLSPGDNLNVPYLEAAFYWLVTYSMLGDLNNPDNEINEITKWLGGQFGVKEEEVSKFHDYGREFLLRTLPKN
ncbi:hypothetical protein L1787_00090 [Acuticoccus sp. M5D2P5]|uniref:hypothetical protein n=1 Tax=Acuticoccus kalidii TaxID=2910977 RepID=UPI001F21AA4A|nr:hypothetical protein [Acuticoccus kalidii]MCF3931812.1 hypothetical protein [Acuticoccus kalidii]